MQRKVEVRQSNLKILFKKRIRKGFQNDDQNHVKQMAIKENRQIGRDHRFIANRNAAETCLLSQVYYLVYLYYIVYVYYLFTQSGILLSQVYIFLKHGIMVFRPCGGLLLKSGNPIRQNFNDSWACFTSSSSAHNAVWTVHVCMKSAHEFCCIFVYNDYKVFFSLKNRRIQCLQTINPLSIYRR